MTWIKTVSYGEAKGRLLALYDRIKGPDNNVDNVMQAHSLRPHSMEGHMALYKNVLHNTGNTVPTWFLEALGVYASMLNDCEYCVEHHQAGMDRLLNDAARAKEVREALESRDWHDTFDERESAALDYVRRLTKAPAEITEEDIQALRKAGWDDGEILEINQVTAYFNYANRFVLGLGVDTAGDILGLSPEDSDDPQSWRHS